MSCPGYPQTPNICNGIPEREAGLIDRCFFSDFTFYTCVRSVPKWISSFLDLTESYYFLSTDARRLRLHWLFQTQLRTLPVAKSRIEREVSRGFFSIGRKLTLVSVPANCSTVYWDPIGGSCTCQSGSCAFQDESRPIGPQGSGYLGGGTNENPTDVDGGTTMDPYQGFSEGVVSMKIPRLLTLAIAGLALFFSGWCNRHISW